MNKLEEAIERLIDAMLDEQTDAVGDVYLIDLERAYLRLRRPITPMQKANIAAWRETARKYFARA